MQTKWIARHLAVTALSAALLGSPAHADQIHGNKDARAGFDGLSREMSTCAAYFSLLASIIENANDATGNLEIAQRIKSTGQLMLTQSINIATYIGLGDEVVMERVQEALKDMVDTVNSDPSNSVRVMHAKYGQPCDELLQTAPKRFAELLEDHQVEMTRLSRHCRGPIAQGHRRRHVDLVFGSMRDRPLSCMFDRRARR